MLNAGHYDEARGLCHNLLHQSPGHPDALYLLGVMAYNQAQHNEACQFLREADRNHPAFTDHQVYNLAIALMAAGHDEEAISAFSRALALNPTLHLACGKMASLLKKVGLLQEANKAIKLAIQMKPDYAEGYYFLGSILLAAERQQDALRAFREALRLGPESFPTAMLLGNGFNQLGYEREASKCYQAALVLYPLSYPAGEMRQKSNALLRKLCAPLTGQVLSIGSGHDLDKEGGLYREYFPAGNSYLRIDFDACNYPDIVADAQNLRGVVADSSCDVIFSIWALEHIPDIQTTISEFHRILRPGGAFIFGLPLNVGYHAFPHDYHRFALDGIRELFRDKFQIEEVYPIGEESPFVLDPKLKLVGTMTAKAPYSFVGRCRKA